jgi:16S rRNA (cytosine1402-N4)-methyltransferase
MAQKKSYHIPVMSNELIKYLKLKQGKTVLDCTVGSAGHAILLLKEVGPKGKLIGIDRDDYALEIARNRLGKRNNYTLMQGNFRNIDTILAELAVDKVDAMVFDLGLSSLQLDSLERGFSIKLDGPLDMRMDRSLKVSAFDLVNFLPQESLSDILEKYGQERWHNRIARAIVRERKKAAIVSTRQLAALVERVVFSGHSRIHAATRTFQALRIAVNDELEALYQALGKCINYLAPGARICVISFHSLEDRIVKNQFRMFAREGKLKIITKKPLTAGTEEISANSRARSAKMRVAERTENGG